MKEGYVNLSNGDDGLCGRGISRRDFMLGSAVAIIASPKRVPENVPKQRNDTLYREADDGVNEITRRDLLRGNFQHKSVVKIQESNDPTWTDDLLKTTVESVGITAGRLALFGIENKMGVYDDARQIEKEWREAGEEFEEISFFDAMKSAVVEEIVLRIGPNILVDLMSKTTPDIGDVARILKNHWIGAKYKDSQTSIEGNMVVGLITGALDTVAHKIQNKETNLQSAIGFGWASYRYWITGSRNMLHSIWSHAINNALMYPIYKRLSSTEK